MAAPLEEVPQRHHTPCSEREREVFASGPQLGEASERFRHTTCSEQARWEREVSTWGSRAGRHLRPPKRIWPACIPEVDLSKEGRMISRWLHK